MGNTAQDDDIRSRWNKTAPISAAMMTFPTVLVFLPWPFAALLNICVALPARLPIASASLLIACAQTLQGREADDAEWFLSSTAEGHGKKMVMIRRRLECSGAI